MDARTIRNMSIALFVLLIIWGLYTYLYYLGVPVHGLIYLDSESAQAVAETCGTQTNAPTFVCRGVQLFFPFLGGFFTMVGPLVPYVLLSLLVYGAVLLVQGFRTGRFALPFTARPLHLIGLFIFSVWLIATTLSFGSTGSGENAQPFTRFYEPTRAIYPSIGEQALNELQANYRELLDGGCLREFMMAGPDGKPAPVTTQSGAKVYTLSGFCMQASLFTRVGAQFALILLLMLNFLAAGRFLLRAMKYRHPSPLLELVFSLGIGSLFWVALLWLVSILGLLKSAILLPLFFGFPLIAFPQSWYWIKSSWHTKLHMDDEHHHLWTLLVWLLVSYLALNFLNVVRPFPIGWDDLGSYLNRPRLLASYGMYVPIFSTFQWEYLSAMAYGMFGLESIVGSTFAMIINWSAGLVTVLATYAFARIFLGRRAGVLAAMLYYFLPMTGHFSFADMKIDNASYFTSALAILAVFVYLFGTPGLSREHSTERGNKTLLFIAGLLISFSFAIKPTAVLALLMIGSVLTGAYFGRFGFLAATFAGFALLSKFAPFNVYEIAKKVGYVLPFQPNSVQLVSMFTLLALGAALFAWSLRQKVSLLKEFGWSVGFFGLGFVVAAAPWMAHNAFSNGAINVGSILGHENNLAPYITYLQQEDVPEELPVSEDKIRYLPADLKLDPEHAACKTSARAEELDRYWGFREGWSHYLTLPWRATMNLDSAGYYVTLIPTLMLFPLLLLLPYFWTKEGRWLRYLFAGTMVFLMQWAFTANGIMWYGIAMFFGLAIGLEALYKKAPDKMSRTVMMICIIAGLLIAGINRMWQFDIQRNLFEYPLGKVTASAIREITIPDYDNIRDSVVERHETVPNRPYTYRMGTFIPYFIPKNIEILPLADNQVQFFNCVNQERDHALTTRRLKALGFNSIIFDTNTATIEQDPNGPLHQKVQAFLNYANDPVSGLQLQVNNPTNGIVYIVIP